VSGISIVLKLSPDAVGTVIHADLTEHEADVMYSAMSSSEKTSSTERATVKQAGVRRKPASSTG
jgi:hypothetical protein